MSSKVSDSLCSFCIAVCTMQPDLYVFMLSHAICGVLASTSLLNLKTWVFVFCFSGSKNSIDCTLILTEGDSAKTLAVSGLGVVGRDKYGVFPLRGKMLNVREASHKQVSGNTLIACAGSCGVLCAIQCVFN